MTTTTTPTAPSVTDFLAQPVTEEDFDDSFDRELVPTPADLPPTPGPLDPGLALASVVGSLEAVAAAFSVVTGFAEERTALADERDVTREQLADLEAKHGVLLDLMAEIEETVKPSTSKLANAVREVLQRWSDPSGEPEAQAGAAAAPDEDVIDPFAPPAADADVEKWRGWARRIRAVPFGEPSEFDSMNRSQIRTALGVEHPGA